MSLNNQPGSYYVHLLYSRAVCCVTSTEFYLSSITVACVLSEVTGKLAGTWLLADRLDYCRFLLSFAHTMHE